MLETSGAPTYASVIQKAISALAHKTVINRAGDGWEFEDENFRDWVRIQIDQSMGRYITVLMS